MLYQDGRNKIELLTTYLYELSIYAIGKNRVELVASKFISSKKEIRIKKPIQIKKCKGYIIEKSIVLLGAPQEYMDKYFLKPCE